jgi:hypothetical protein
VYAPGGGVGGVGLSDEMLKASGFGPGVQGGGGFQGINALGDEMALGGGGAGMMGAVDARPDLAGAAGRGFVPPPADADPGMGGWSGASAPQMQGLFDSLGRVGAGLPPSEGVRPRPMPFNRPGAALGGF